MKWMKEAYTKEQIDEMEDWGNSLVDELLKKKISLIRCMKPMIVSGFI